MHLSIPLDYENGDNPVPQGSKRIQSIVTKSSRFLYTHNYAHDPILMGSQWIFYNKWKPKNEIIMCISLSWKPFALFLWMSSCKDISPTSSALKYIF